MHARAGSDTISCSRTFNPVAMMYQDFSIDEEPVHVDQVIWGFIHNYIFEGTLAAYAHISKAMTFLFTGIYIANGDNVDVIRLQDVLGRHL